MKSALYPLVFEPVYQPYVWGGDRIIRHFNREASQGVYAESWEISDRSEGASVVANGPLAGSDLGTLITRYGTELLGDVGPSNAFPLLIKLIDARETLSVQVHPDDEAAARFGGEPKTEMWYVLDADPDACVYAGLKPGVDADAFRRGIEQKTLDQLLNRVPVKAGDVIYMPGGRVHAIGAGCLLLEVQQNSNTTYRLYDWGRLGADGAPRPLHIDAGLQATRWHERGEPVMCTPRRLGHMERNELWEVLSCRYFRMERLMVNEPWPSAHDGRSFQALFCTDAPVAIKTDGETLWLEPGTTCLIPAAVTSYAVCPVEEPSTVLRVTGPSASTDA